MELAQLEKFEITIDLAIEAIEFNRQFREYQKLKECVDYRLEVQERELELNYL